MKIVGYFNRLKLNIKFTIVTIFVTVIPIAILAGILFYYMEQSVIKEQLRQMEYKMEKAKSTTAFGIDSINMSTQFFLSDEDMTEVLKRAYNGDALTIQELLEFQERDVINLQRLVNNNPLLYSVRIFSTNDNVQELMPVLYSHSRMEKLSWAGEDPVQGWHFEYYDTAYSALTTNQSEKLIGLVTPITDYRYGLIGYVEASMSLDTMFPLLYERKDGAGGCLIDADGNIYFGTEESEYGENEIQEIYGLVKAESDTETHYIRYNHQKLIVSTTQINEMNSTLLGIHDITREVQAVLDMRNVFVAAMLLILCLLAMIIDQIVKRMLRQFYSILRSIRLVQKGDLSVRIDAYANDEMGELGAQLNKMLDRIQELMDENMKRQMLVKNSEIRALQNQINAHFIYNVLESIKMMAEIDEKYEISDAITALGKLLRYSMRWVSGNVKLEEELEYIKSYMVLINLRYDYEIILALNLPEELLSQEIPKMSLQPIVENAILHGIEPLSEDSTIYIKGWIENDDCIIEISDTGQGMTDAQVRALEDKINGAVEESGGNGHGIGLKNVQDRIHMSFGGNYGIRIASKYGCYTKIAIRLPHYSREKPQIPEGNIEK